MFTLQYTSIYVTSNALTMKYLNRNIYKFFVKYGSGKHLKVINTIEI
jgi:hypothetical protein